VPSCQLFLVQFDDFEAGDASLITRAVEDAAETVGNKLIYVAVAGRLTPPEERVRPEIIQGLERVLELCAEVHLVVQQQGFVGAIHRTIAAGMMLTIDRRGKKIGIHSSLEDALASSKEVQIAPDIVVKIARARRIIP